MSALRFAWRLLRRDWRSGELRLLVVALAVAAGAVTAVGFFTNRVEQLLEQQAGELLAADLVVETSDPPAPELREEAERLGLRTARTLSFPSVVFKGETSQLVQVKAVSSAYPLRGELRVSEQRDGPAGTQSGPPAAGGAWVEPQLLGLLGSHLGDTLELGDSDFAIRGLIDWEPDRGSNLFRLAPRVMIALDDLEATGLLGPASRVRHRLLVAGDSDKVADYRAWLSSRLPRGAEIESIGASRPELSSALDQGRRFLGLAALTAVLLVGVAVALATRRFVDRQADTSAIMRCLGASRSFVLQVVVLRLVLLAGSAGAIGALGGLAAQQALAWLVSDWLARPLPAPSLAPLFQGIAVGLVTLLGFGLAPLLRLGQVSPLRVLRRDLGTAPPQFWITVVVAAAAFSGLVIWQAGDARMAMRILGGIAATLIALVLAATALIHLLSPLRYRSGTIWRYALASLTRNRPITVLQLVGFGLGVMALLLLAVVRLDLLQAWEAKLPADTPNHFLINIQPAEADALRALIESQGLETAGVYPMLRGRLTHIGQHEVRADDYDSPRAKRLATREFNLSWADRLQEDNALVAGRWWPASESEDLEFSVEEGIAETLGIRLGDRLTYQIAGSAVSGEVTSLRSVQWDSFNPNFFVIANPGPLAKYPGTFITSFYLPTDRTEVLRKLVDRFPSVTALDVNAIMSQVRLIMDRGSRAVELVFGFTLLAGLVVFYAGVQAGREARMQEAAVLRTLGLQRAELLGATATEFATLGLLAGTLGALGATLVGRLLASQVFGLPYEGNPWMLLGGALGGGLGVAIAGLIVTYPVLRRSPVEVFRSA